MTKVTTTDTRPTVPRRAGHSHRGACGARAGARCRSGPGATPCVSTEIRARSLRATRAPDPASDVVQP
eukprot:2941909-Prymnesium_polylepis.1